VAKKKRSKRRRSPETQTIRSGSAGTIPLSPSPIDHKEALNKVQTLDTKVQAALEPVAAEIDEWLASLEGQKLNEHGKEVIDAIKLLVRRAGRRLLYPGNPVTIQCVCGPTQKIPTLQVRGHSAGSRKILLNSIKVPPLKTGPITD
jgi:hypothetical protein